MRIDQPGPVTERIALLGRRESCVYLVRGREASAILGGGLSYIVPDVVKQLARMAVDPTRIRYLVIHHTHFDHVGIAPYFQKNWPWIQVVASVRGRAQLARPEVWDSIVGLNRMLLDSRNMGERWMEFGLNGEPIRVDVTPAEGQTLDLGDLSLCFLATPGHSSCSMAAYIPEEKALSPSDAGGIPFSDHVFAAANSNFDQYQASLEKMAALDIEVYLAEHYGALNGPEGRDFLVRSMAAARSTRAALEATWARTRDESQTVAEMIEAISAKTGGYFLPREVMEMVLAQMTRFIAKRMGS